MSITYHVCKYTPTELLTALGGQCALLDEAPENFDLSDQVAHPNLCGFGKSVIQAALAGQVKELVLVNCCDTIRSVCDVLEESGYDVANLRGANHDLGKLYIALETALRI